MIPTVRESIVGYIDIDHMFSHQVYSLDGRKYKLDRTGRDLKELLQSSSTLLFMDEEADV